MDNFDTLFEFQANPQFEKSLVQAFNIPPVRPEFVQILLADLDQKAARSTRPTSKWFGLRPAWTFGFIFLLTLFMIVLIVGPQQVYAALQRFIGYIPGVGVVDQSAPLRVLKQPVSMTREGITVSVNQAVLTAVDTKLQYGISAVPLSAYAALPTDPQCLELPRLKLPDGTLLESHMPVPADVSEALFVLPCIAETMPSAAPENWAIALQFVPAPSGLALPVIDLTPQVTKLIESTPIGTPIGSPMAGQVDPSQVLISVDQMVETDEGFILSGSIQPVQSMLHRVEIIGPLMAQDSSGKRIPPALLTDFTPPFRPEIYDIGGIQWTYAFKASDVAFPITITVPGVVIRQIDPEAEARLTVDVGTGLKEGQIVEVNQSVTLAGNEIKLVSIEVNELDGMQGYQYTIDPSPNLVGATLVLEGVQTLGGGGGQLTIQGQTYKVNEVYDQRPEGKLNFIFSNPIAASEPSEWQVQWQPETPKTFVEAEKPDGICADTAMLDQATELPKSIRGTVHLANPGLEYQTTFSALDGSNQELAASSPAWLSPDGSRLVISHPDQLELKNLQSGESQFLDSQGFDEMVWSADSKFLAGLRYGEGISLIQVEGNARKTLTNLGYESLAGFSPDGGLLYYAIPAATGDGYLFRAINLANGNSQDVFVLENSSLKAPAPVLSPDGQWVVFRSVDHKGLYLKAMQGKDPARLIWQTDEDVVSGFQWDKSSEWLGISLISPQSQQENHFLLNPHSCRLYRLPGLKGEIQRIDLEE